MCEQQAQEDLANHGQLAERPTQDELTAIQSRDLIGRLVVHAKEAASTRQQLHGQREGAGSSAHYGHLGFSQFAGQDLFCLKFVCSARAAAFSLFNLFNHLACFLSFWWGWGESNFQSCQLKVLRQQQQDTRAAKSRLQSINQVCVCVCVVIR